MIWFSSREWRYPSLSWLRLFIHRKNPYCRCSSGTTNSLPSQDTTEDLWLGIKITRTGHELSRCSISPCISLWTIRQKRMEQFIMCRGHIVGIEWKTVKKFRCLSQISISQTWQVSTRYWLKKNSRCFNPCRAYWRKVTHHFIILSLFMGRIRIVLHLLGVQRCSTILLRVRKVIRMSLCCEAYR